MQQFMRLVAAMVVVLVVTAAGPNASCDEWPGVDEAVVKKFADQAGHPAREPFINPRGDVLLFVFLLAGVIGGFVAGYHFRGLFPPHTNAESKV